MKKNKIKKLSNYEKFGFLKTHLDAHTLGLFSFANLIKDCGYKVFIGGDKISKSIVYIDNNRNWQLIKNWILKNKISIISFSYRLDPLDGVNYFINLLNRLKRDKLLYQDRGIIKKVYFAGLPSACNLVKKKTASKEVEVFKGGENSLELLKKIGVPKERLPKGLLKNNNYDNLRYNFAKRLIEKKEYLKEKPLSHSGYKDFGTKKDSLIKRLTFCEKNNTLPIIRTHIGPYGNDRKKAVNNFIKWVKKLSKDKYLDVLSIGTSQLTQSNFGESWKNLINGGGVPINSVSEYVHIYKVAKPMLVRTYSGSKNIKKLAKIYNDNINMAWHALSLWWFCETDGRGPNPLLKNLKEHFETIKFIAKTNRTFEPNVSHQFAFRGTDDISYIISAFLSAKCAKKLGIKYLVLQNMLNTPKTTWGIQDIAKARVMLKIVRELEDQNFKVIFQPRAGLDYFSNNIKQAKIQLASVVALMDDIEPRNNKSPELIHVVNYSEGVCLANPNIVNESIKITLNTLREYRRLKEIGKINIDIFEKEITQRTKEIYKETKEAIKFLENKFKELYTPEIFYKIFIDGYFPVPHLVDSKNKYTNAKIYKTMIKNGEIKVIDNNGNVIKTIDRYKKIYYNK